MTQNQNKPESDLIRSNLISRVENQWLLVAVIAGVAILISVFARWEIGHETVGYWLFARIFAETGDFVITDRSPLYTVYLNGFRWIGYPHSVTAEYLVSTVIVVAAMIAVFRPYLRPLWCVFAVILWLPVLQLAEPSVQKMALACVCWAVVARRARPGVYGSAASYSLLGMAYMFRSPFLLFLVVFLAWDMLTLIRSGRFRILATCNGWRPRLTQLPLVLLIALMVLFMARQSESSWNNVYFSSTEYFPNDGKSFTMVQNWNWGYIINHHQTFIGNDFYNTNIELFNGASSTLDMVRANPKFVAKQTFRWGRDFVIIGARMTEFPRFWSWAPLGNHYFAPTLLAALVFGAFAATRKKSDISMSLLVVGAILLVGSTVVTRPEGRYMVPVIPVLILSSVWYLDQAQRLSETWLKSKPKILFWGGVAGVVALTIYFAVHANFHITNFGPATSALLHPSIDEGLGPDWGYTLVFVVFGYAVAASLILRSWNKASLVSQWATRWVNLLLIPVILILFSNGLVLWKIYGHGAFNNLRDGEIRVMELRGGLSIKDSRETLSSLTSKCRGVLAIEHAAISAFTDVPLDRVYDVMEIPPFGTLSDSAYNGLRPDRVDCVLVSGTLATMVGAATNVKLRYDNYIVPYVEKLKDMGATTIPVPNFGEAIILNRP